MLNESRRVLPWALPLCFAASLLPSTLHAQAQVETTLQRQLNRLDLGVSAAAVYTGSGSGQSYANTNPRPSESQRLNFNNTTPVGVIVQLRYTKSPLLGAEFNFTTARITTSFVPVSSTGTNVVPGGVQSNAQEISLGYVAHGPELLGFGIKPFGSVGAGVTVFTPTVNGGLGLQQQGRATYYYSAGVEAPLFHYVGVRAQVRQSFFLLPDFQANYLTIKQRTNSFEPAVGFYLHF